jgi:hypothetical protein
MKTLMRNGRDRRSENPFVGHARKERVLLIGTDQRIISGPAARTAALRGRIHDCTRIVFAKGQLTPWLRPGSHTGDRENKVGKAESNNRSPARNTLRRRLDQSDAHRRSSIRPVRTQYAFGACNGAMAQQGIGDRLAERLGQGFPCMALIVTI